MICRAWPLRISALLLAGLLIFSGCATLSNRQKTLLTMLGAGVVAGTAGAMLAPSDEKPLGHAALWGGVAAATTGAIGLFVFDEQKRSEEFQRENSVMRKEISAFRDEGSSSHEPTLLYETNAPFGKEIPSEYSGLVKPGRWSVYRLNQWVNQGEGTIIHQDRLVKLIPPQLTPMNATDLNETDKSSSKNTGSSEIVNQVTNKK